MAVEKAIASSSLVEVVDWILRGHFWDVHKIIKIPY